MKKLLSFLLVVAMLFTTVLVAIPTAAEELEIGQVAPDYEAVGTPITQETVFPINASGDYYLAEDLVFEGPTSKTYLFTNGALSGTTLDGNGYSITWGTEADPATEAVFDGWENNVTLKNITIEGIMTIDNPSWAMGALTSDWDGNNGVCTDNVVLIENCVFDIDQIYTKVPTDHVGGLIGKWQSDVGTSSLTFNKVINKGDIIIQKEGGTATANGTNNKQIGGFLANVSNVDNVYFYDCTYEGDIIVDLKDVNLYVGGFVGKSTLAENKLIMEDCIVGEDASINVKSNIATNDSAIGGVVGYAASMSAEDITNNADMTVACQARTGGVIGQIGSGDIAYLANNGDITVNSKVATFGGVIGQLGSGMSANYLANNGNILINAGSDWGKMGGVIGDINGGRVEFSFIANSGNMTVIKSATADAIGGVFGCIANAEDGSYMSEIQNSGTILVAGRRNLGGIVGLLSNSYMDAYSIHNEGRVELIGDFWEDEENNPPHKGVGGLFGRIDNADGVQEVSLGDVINDGDVLMTREAFNEEKIDFCKDIHVGGIAGYVNSVAEFVLIGAYNVGDVSYDVGTSIGWESVGGIVGGILCPRAENSVYAIVDAYNAGKITGADNTGGILGGTKQLAEDTTVVIQSCYNIGEVYGTKYTGGIMGKVSDSTEQFSDLYIVECANVGTVVSKTYTAGGILGGYRDTNGAEDYATIAYCVNDGSVFVEEAYVPYDSETNNSLVKVGGILGDFSSRIELSCNLHMGTLGTGYDIEEGTYSDDATFPITNAIETKYNGTEPSYDEEWFFGGNDDYGMLGYSEGYYTEESAKLTYYTRTDGLKIENPYVLSKEISLESAYSLMHYIELPYYDEEVGEYGNELLTYAMGIPNANYSTRSWENLQNAISELYYIYDADQAPLQGELNRAILELLIAIDELRAEGTDTYYPIEEALDYADKQMVSGAVYTAESLAKYEAAVAAANKLMLDGVTDEYLISDAAMYIYFAVETLELGGTIKTADDFARLDGQSGWFELANDIYVTEPVENFSGVLDGNGHFIYTTSALFENLEDVEMYDFTVVAIDDLDASLFGTAVGYVDIMDVNVMVRSMSDAALFTKVAGTDVWLEDIEEIGAVTSKVCLYGVSVYVQGEINATAGLVATVEDTAVLIVSDSAFIGNVNGLAGLVGASKGSVTITNTIFYGDVIATEEASGLASGAKYLNISNCYVQGKNTADGAYLFTADEDAEVENCYGFVVDGKGALIDGVDVYKLASGEATYNLNKTMANARFVQMIGVDALPVLGTPNADGSNIVYEEDGKYFNVGSSIPDNVAPAFPDYYTPAGNVYKLGALIEYATERNLDGYSAASVEEYNNALQAAIKAMFSLDQAEIDAAEEALSAAIGKLAVDVPNVPAELVDASALDAVIAKAEALKAEDYSADTWATLVAVVDAAKRVSKAVISQKDVDVAKAAVDAAIEALVSANAPVVEVNCDKIDAAIAKAEALKASDYTTATWATLKAALDSAKYAAAAVESQNAVNQANTALERALAGLIAVETPESTEEKGCGSVIGAGAIALVTVMALGAGVVLKKKED